MFQRRCAKSGNDVQLECAPREFSPRAATACDSCRRAAAPACRRCRSSNSGRRLGKERARRRSIRASPVAPWPVGSLLRAAQAGHVFHADVAPPSDNAGAEIVIHERDRRGPESRFAPRLQDRDFAQARRHSRRGAELQAPRTARGSHGARHSPLGRWRAGLQRICRALPVSGAEKAEQPVAPFPLPTQRRNAR